MFTGRPGRLKRFDYVGLYRYFLTFCTDRRRKVFVSAEPVDLALGQIRHAGADEGFAIFAYCFMPDHAHLLVEGVRDDSDCRRFIKRAKQLSGYYYIQKYGPRLWQRYAYEHVLRSDEATLAVAKYILENPVRAGLVAEPGSYEFLGSDRYALCEILEAAGEWRSQRSRGGFTNEST